MFFIMGAKRKSGYEVLLAINPGAGENGVRGMRSRRVNWSGM